MRRVPRKIRPLTYAGLVLVPLVAVPVALVAQDVLTMDNEEQKDWLTSFVQDRLSTPERQIRLSNIDGILGSDVSVREITISDQQGVWLRINNASLNWNQAALFGGRLEVRSLTADSIEYLRNAIPAEGVDLPPPEAGSLEIPEFPVAIQLDELSVPRVTFGEQVFGLGSEISLAGALTLEGGNLVANLDIDRLDGPGGALDLAVDYRRENNVIDLGLNLTEPPNGVLANLLNIEGRPAMELTLNGSGPVADLRADMAVLADGQTALSGTATVAQRDEGFAITADLGGPLSTLVAEPYRPFFGPETALSARALLGREGGIELTGLNLAGGQLSLEASASLTPDNFLSRLDLQAVVADTAGNRVILPVAGSATSVDAARLTVDFGTGGGENWRADLDLDGFASQDFAAQSIALGIGGIASNLDNPATRRVTFNGDGAIAGISADPGVEAALGDSVGLGIAGLWNAGEPLQLAELRIVGEALGARMSGIVDGFAFAGDIGLETSNIAPFSGLAGRDLSGAVDIAANGQVMPLTGGFDLTFDGTGTNLAIDDPTADALLEGTVRLAGRLGRTTAGITADEFSIANNQVQFRADGTYASDTADFSIALDLSDLALLSEQASGALSLRGSARSADAQSPLLLLLDGQVPTGVLAGRDLREGQFALSAVVNDSGVSGDIAGSALLDGHRAELSGKIAANDATQTLSELSFRIAGTRIAGGIERTVETGLLIGGLDVTAPDISLAAALALTEASGAINATVRLVPDNGTQSASVNANVSDLRINDISLERADVAARFGDLFGVPSADGTLTANAVSVAGVEISALQARASQTNNSTWFDTQLALATGADLDLAGSLTPIAGGYSLALERANLEDGDFSASLANRAQLLVRGESVALDAVRFDVGSGRVTATGSVGGKLDLVVDIAALPLSIANSFARDLDLSGTVDGRATVTGNASDPQVRFEARASGISAAAIEPFGIAPLSVDAGGSYAGNVIALDRISANGAGGLALSGSGRIPLSGNGLDIALNGSAPLGLANRFVVERGGQLTGTASFDARVGGSLANPQFSGAVSTSGAEFIDPELNLRLTGITGRATLSGDRANIETLSAGLSGGGSVSASGSIGLSDGLPADLAISVNSARYADGDLFVATLSGGLTLTGNLTGTPLLAGNVLVEQANITVPESFGGAAQLIDVEHVRTPAPVQQTLDRARIGTAGASDAPARTSGLVLDVNVNAPNQIFIRGRGLDAEVGGSVRLTGPLNDIQPVGAFSLTRGRLSILGQRITFESGSVTLVGDLDPFLNLIARTEGDGITVFVTVSGRVSAPDITFSSSPVLPQDEVLSRLIFNRSMGELSPLQLARLAAAAAELVGGGGGGLVDGLRGAAGLADLDVVTDDAGNVGVQAGTYLQDNVYLGVTAGANGQSKVTINLDVTDDLTLKGSAGQDGNSSLGIFYERDY